ncbi:M6 family metalloprotease domain-containing protein [Noviherbaspirillum aridicola]|uniref:Peptidase M6-like domain-containing protein n=1 Tax=Noviherbaspirillum aridicola TaxID=2849687 RepID=A0ABQ4Q7Z9_9BURK|nr:M6 family metalloprotease domain-containing protein [Noviherbaspirillum aridicola]GIZ52834.1 hypothetical protein NCCP691_28480 [Noviherbaspirillum aridicola]
MSSFCEHSRPGPEAIECRVPPSPEAQKRIDASRRRLEAGMALPEKPTADQLDLKTLALILARPPATRANTLTITRSERAPVTGSRKVIVLLVDFPDKPGTRSKESIHELLFSRGTFASGSMRDYYAEVSGNRLDVSGEVHGWLRAPQPKSYYTNGDYGFAAYPRNAQKLVEDVLDLADGVVDFAPFDNDGNGVVEALVVIAAGSGAEQTLKIDDLWSHKWSITPKTVDGKRVTAYFMAPEDGKVGVMAHELGHLLLGMPDLYDIDYGSRGTGSWDLMAAGSWNNNGDTPAHPCAWVKSKVGWANIDTVFDAERDIALPPYATSNSVVRVSVGSADGKQYFLLSNRRKLGFDAHIPGEGLLIEHVDENQQNNTDENHYLVDIEQCDGLRQLNLNQNAGDAGDAWPAGGQSAFNAGTTPSSKTYDGADSRVDISAIASAGTGITARVRAGSDAGGGGGGFVWHNDRTVTQAFASADAGNAWVNLAGLGWRRVSPGAADGITNLFAMLCEALANGRKAHVYADASAVTIAYLD